ncbi:AAA family ATPase [Vibrio olivae]
MINDAQVLANRFTKEVGVIETDNALKLAEEQLGFYFDDEQKEAIYYTLCSGDFSITQGSAGAGKTTLMLAAKIAYEQKNMNIKGACIAKKKLRIT